MKPTILMLQYFQELHDKQYHFDIYSKPLIDRLSHLFKHLVKYSSTELKRVSTYPDALACVLSMANVLNMDISKELEKDNQIAYSIDTVRPVFHKDILIEQYSFALGQMAKVLEGYDHVEPIEYKASLKDWVRRILIVLLQIRVDLDELSLDTLTIEYIKKMFKLKRNHIFFAHYHDEDLKRPLYRSMVALERAA